LPFCRVTLRGRNLQLGYHEKLEHLGEHIRKARLDRGQRQREAAEAIGCHPSSLLNWERGRAVPELRFLPAILCFLGYDGHRDRASGAVPDLIEEMLLAALLSPEIFAVGEGIPLTCWPGST
jgi:transcriptional regulator with XRE-family HTH domain